MDDKSSHISDKIRHLYIKRGNEHCESFRPCWLRTLFNGSSIHLADILSVRVLGLIGSNVYAFAASFCRLKHLRYLAIKEVDLETLPDSICLLYNLQTLKLSYCYQLRELPSNIINLVNLLYLHIAHAQIEELPSMLWQVHNLQMLHLEECGHLKLLPPGISNLTNLQILRLKLCKNLLELPSDIGNLVNLKILDLSFSGIRTWPASLGLVLKSTKLELVGVPKDLRTSLSLDQVPRMATGFNTDFCEEKPKNVMVRVSFKTSHKVIDICRFGGYDELRYNIALSFDIQELLLNTPGMEGWKITYFRRSGNGEFLFGSESWHDFVRSVEIIKITGPSECYEKYGVSGIPEVYYAEDDGRSSSRNTWMSSHGTRSTLEIVHE